MKAVFLLIENVIFFNKFFHSGRWNQNLVETVFFYLQLFYLFMETIISSKIRFH